MIFAKLYNKMKKKFDTKVNKAIYHTDWSLMTYSILKTEKINIRKINLEVLQILLNKLRLCQWASSLSYISENQLIATTKRVYHGVSELEFALFPL